MNKYLVVTHKVRDYGEWKKEFDDSEELRREYGLKGGWLFCNIDQRSEITVMLEMEDEDRARDFAQSQELKDAMQRAGVEDEPRFYFIEKLADVMELAHSVYEGEEGYEFQGC